MYRIPINIHQTIQADLNEGKSTTSILRQLCKSVIQDIEIWANGNKSKLEIEQPILLACRGNLNFYALYDCNLR
jgi:hypothetical protein